MYSLSNIDICNSQYFRGCSKPVVQVLVDCNTTYRMVKESLLDYQTYEHLFDNPFFVDKEKGIGDSNEFDGDIYKQAVEDFFSKFVSIDYVPDSFAGMDSMEDCEEYDCYMYFVVDLGEEE